VIMTWSERSENARSSEEPAGERYERMESPQGAQSTLAVYSV
jgi:hypothetical protein